MVAYVFSIKKEYGLNLLEGRALYEYRRRKSPIKIDDKIILYATSPDKEIIGEFAVGEIIIGTPGEVWEKTRMNVCYPIEKVISYLKSGDYPIAFRVLNPRKYKNPLHLSQIRSFFHPPMSYCRASEQLLSRILL